MPFEPLNEAAPATKVASGSWFDRLSERQMCWLVVLFGLLLYIPLAGTYGLWDPWETHYSEVARQMTKRSDFISLWWPGSPRDADVFWSKPVLSFWIMSIGMHIAGVGLPGGTPGEMAIGSHAEWAVRVPFCLMGVLGILGVYMVVARFVSRRAGVLAAVVLATSPMYSLVARQAMTDMAFVGPMTLALALGGLALFDDEDRELPRRGKGLFSWPHDSLFYWTVAVFALTAIPQFVIDSIQLKIDLPREHGVLRIYGSAVMLPYIAGVVAFLLLAARTRFKAPLYLYLAAILCALAVLAKGLAGLGLPLIVFMAYLGFTWNWARLRRAQLMYGVLVSFLALVVVAVPWHHAMLIRHGLPFWNELFGDNHWRRMVLGRHGDRGTFEYFIRELGYAVWPWVLLAPGAVAWAVMRRTRPAPTPAAARAQGIIWQGAIWCVAAYEIESKAMTKLHHNVLPAVTGLDICIACIHDDLLDRPDRRRILLVLLVGTPLLAAVTVDFTSAQNASQRFLWLFSYDYIHSAKGRPWPPVLDFTAPVAAIAVLFTVAAFALLARPGRRRWAAGAMGVVAVAATFFLLDDFMRKVAPFWSQKDVIAAYYKTRRSPAEKMLAYQLYWRGETFYSENEIYEGPVEERTVFDAEGADDKFHKYIAAHRGRRVFILCEKGQKGKVEGMLPVEVRPSVTVIHDSNTKFLLLQADL